MTITSATPSIAAVHAPEGWVSAFANVVPEYQRDEVTIDLMRHRRVISSTPARQTWRKRLAAVQANDGKDGTLRSLAGWGK